MKQYLLLFSILSLSVLATSQTLEDAIRYNSRDQIGTARGFGAGSSMGAIGGDFGSLASNPAGIAMFKWSEFQISPSVFVGPTTSTLTAAIGDERSANRTRVMLPSLSYVQVKPAGQGMMRDGDRIEQRSRYGWTRSVMGFGVNRIANFNRKFAFEGDQDYSITQLFIEQSDQIDPDFLDDFIGGPAYDAFITTYDYGTGDYIADIDENTVVKKSQVVSQKGGIDELSFTFGADYANKFQVGGSVNLPIYNFKEKKQYRESIEGHPIFNNIEYDENLKIVGSGFNMKVGAKYIISRKVHVAAAFHSPTWSNLTEEYDTRATYDYKFDPDLFPSAGPTDEASPLGEFEYTYRSPWRATGGLGVIIGKLGFLSAEAEYTQHTSSKFTIADDPGYENQLNEEIDFELSNTLKLRIGAEVRIKKFRLRGGVGFAENVFASESGLEQNSLSLGAGIWIDRFFIDAGFRHESIDQRYSPYTLGRGPSPIVNSTLNENNIVLTFGVKI